MTSQKVSAPVEYEVSKAVAATKADMKKIAPIPQEKPMPVKEKPSEETEKTTKYDANTERLVEQLKATSLSILAAAE